jgi:hypothetical protein
MISIRSSADMARALAGALEPPLRRLLTLRRDQLMEHDDYDLGELAHFIVVQPGDALAGIEAEAGLPVDFSSFEYVERRCGWLEAVLILSDDGFGLVLFVPDRIDVDPALLVPLLNQL